MSPTLVPTRNHLRVQRHPENPILSAYDWPYPANAVFNAGATRLKDGATLLLCRVEAMTGISHLCAARSQNGVDNWNIDPEPTFAPHPDHPEEEWGVEDPRITYLPDEDVYAVVYTAYSHNGPGVALALTEDFKTFERKGVIFTPEDKDAAIFPRRLGGKWAALHRPVTPDSANIYLSYSDNLIGWGQSRCVLEARRGPWWDANKVGMSPPPIETAEGWLVMYHGVKETASGRLYRNGLALYDLEQPEQLLKRSDAWMFGPLEAYERLGDVDNVVFPCGYTVDNDDDGLNIYYGAADTCIGLAQTKISELLEWLHQNSS